MVRSVLFLRNANQILTDFIFSEKREREKTRESRLAQENRIGAGDTQPLAAPISHVAPFPLLTCAILCCSVTNRNSTEATCSGLSMTDSPRPGRPIRSPKP